MIWEANYLGNPGDINLSLLWSLIFTVVKLNLSFQKGSNRSFHSNFAQIILLITLSLSYSPN